MMRRRALHSLRSWYTKEELLRPRTTSSDGERRLDEKGGGEFRLLRTRETTTLLLRKREIAIRAGKGAFVVRRGGGKGGAAILGSRVWGESFLEEKQSI